MSQVSMVLFDLNLLGMNGWDIFRAFRALRPNIPLVIASGYDDAEAVRCDRSRLPHVFLHKPYQLADLEVALRAIRQMPQSTCQ